MVKLVKNGSAKILSAESSLIEVLKKDGWVVEGAEDQAPAVDAPRRGRPPKASYDVVVENVE